MRMHFPFFNKSPYSVTWIYTPLCVISFFCKDVNAHRSQPRDAAGEQSEYLF